MSYNSAAQLDSSALLTFVDKARLGALLEARGLELLPAPFGARDQHPISIELWHVVAGELAALGLPQQTWFERAGASSTALAASSAGGALGASVGAWGGASVLGAWGMALGPLGAWLGACSGFALGGAWGAALGASSAAVSGSTWGAQLGRHWSAAASRSFGSYDEVLISVPNVRLARSQSAPARFVLGMCSDSPLSIWGDRMLGCGYAKRLCEIARDDFRSYEVRERAPMSYTSLSARFEPLEADVWHSVGAQLDLHRQLADQPLLGSLGQGRFVLTRLERAWGASGALFRPVHAQLSAREELAPGMPLAAVALAPLSAELPWGAYQIRGLPVRLTDPEPATPTTA
jgi:hypothetical protein